ncbi:DNA polymerase [Candidatus Methylomirabilis lanthanidiphila]|uniref:DNA polymerase n=1 Tax=Candidatus Methylomirabilis lanthanidiphila TaxID=2211376 RepID=A0A564ZK23_9BACT|nr:DNA polymerase [Candidatus Methylomirabilis lanthanidiphila]
MCHIPLDHVRPTSDHVGCTAEHNTAVAAHGQGVTNSNDTNRRILTKSRSFSVTSTQPASLQESAVLWPTVFARYAPLAKTATLLGVTGTLQADLSACDHAQAEQGVVHLIADHLWQPKLGANLATAPSRDFH